MKQKGKKTLSKIKKILKENKPQLADKFKVKSIGIFGSYVHGGVKERSDIDILVEFSETIDLLDFVALERFLSEQIGIKVDLVMKSALKPRIGRHVLEEVVYI